MNQLRKKLNVLILIFLSTINCTFAQTESNKEITKQALELINSTEPNFKPVEHQQLDPAALADLGFEQVYKNEIVTFKTKDGRSINSYKYNFERSNTTIILIHGVLSSGFMMNKTAGLLRETIKAEVYAIDLRGHGNSEGVPGDVNYNNQYSHDLMEIIKSIKEKKPNNKILIAGHSMGGGIALNYALEETKLLVDGYILFAPLLGFESPTIPKPTENETKENENEFMKLHMSRIIGLKMLNSIGNHNYDSLRVMFFNLPKEMPLTSYTYRANESMTPEDYKSGLAAIKKPLIVLVGSNDEAFVAQNFKSVIKENSNGEIHIIDKQTHNGIRHDKKSMDLIKMWFNKNFAVQ